MRQTKSKSVLETAFKYRTIAQTANEMARQLEHYAEIDNEDLLAFLSSLCDAMPQIFDLKGFEDFYYEVRDELEEEDEAAERENGREQMALASWLRGQQ